MDSDLLAMKRYTLAKSVAKAGIFIVIFSMSACNEDFVKVDVDKAQITKDLVFSSDLTATSAITGIYNNMYTSGTSFANGTTYSITALSGLSADEINFFPNNLNWEQFEENNLSPQNDNVFQLWKSLYHTIYQANSALDGLKNSTTIANSIKDQLEGEVLFIRAFSHFYLVNLFGDVPLVTTTDYTVNLKIERSGVAEVYEQVVDDLHRALSLMRDEYATNGRVRPNRSTATALLARVYLYAKTWANAEAEASILIGDSRYRLEANLDKVFLGTSTEAIWQLMPPGTARNTNEGFTFILTGAPSTLSSPLELSPNLVNSFETGDARRTKWIKSITSGTTYYFPFKYKIKNGGTSSNPQVPLTEYSMVFRLAEQYLIRAEARAQQDDLAGAIADLDAIRARAALPLIAHTNPSISKIDLLLAIEQERQVELFMEWGHRWLDLKRTGRADVILNGKRDWTSSAKLYPIPQSELDRNHQLGNQNAGY